MNQHLHNQLGNAIGTCKRRMFDQLNDGMDLQEAMASFFAELSLAFDEIVKKTLPQINVSPDSMPH